ncbi:hypothetical protein M2271_006607 [Streptomyces sp. LBL]|uniref:DUF4192 domain-containing protein n=1 Tax=Streptomyces sp. LBL TaxID=2940562 RepID=UPI00247489E2|nr:DUF4192 domain-containing protein [Streptomyces sp. LBL]MDH6628772.1 hypothetical protein [Streptomyces sp. LBL]
MTNHSETTGSAGNGDIGGRDGYETPGARGADGGSAGADEHVECVTYDAHGSDHQITLRTPGELADALPYLLGYRPEDSIVLVALHDRGGRGRFGGRARLGIPPNEDDWESAARQLAHGLITGSERRGVKPEQMVAYLCQEPAQGESGQQVMQRLAGLAGLLRRECGRLDVPVIEALCISGGRFWSYCCPSEGCCPVDGIPMGLPGTSVLAAAATYAGLQVRGTLRELRARLLPWETAAALEQEIVLDTSSMARVPRMLDEADRLAVAEETVELAERIMTRLAEVPPVSGALQADLRDDALLGHEEAATLILGLQDRTTRDRAAEWMEGDEAGPALRLWRALARRCVGPYGEHAAALLTLAGWVAWSAGDEIEAREALAMALGADPDYVFARLLHQACNEGLDPESIRSCLRAEREARTARARLAGEGADAAAQAEVPTHRHSAVSAEEETQVFAQQDVSRGDVPCGDAATSPPTSEAASRRRRRTRAGSPPEGRPRPAEAGGRPSGRNEPRARTRPTAGTRRGTAGVGESRLRPPGKDGAGQRSSGKGNARRRGACSDGVLSAGDDTEGTP